MNGRIALALVALALALALFVPAGGAADKGTASLAERASLALLEQARGAYAVGEIRRSIGLFEMAAVAYPKNARAFAELGHAYETAGDLPRARKFLAIALAIEPGDTEVLAWAGTLDAARADFEAALEKLARIERLCAGDCAPYRSLKQAIDRASAARPTSEASSAAVARLEPRP